MTLQAQNISVSLGGQPVVRGVSFHAERGENIAIVGPNGCGKSTLLRSLIGAVRVDEGQACFEGKAITDLPPKRRASTIGLLSQEEAVPSMTTVFDYVSAGRHPYRSYFRGMTTRDMQIVSDALDLLDIVHLKSRVVERLSGGERQRVRLATLLAQDSQVMLLDEPMTGLDLCHQYQLLKIIANTERESKKTMISVMHDIDMSLRFFTRLLVMKEGQVVADGVPQEILTDALIQDVFGVCGQIKTIPESSFPLFVCDPL